MIHWQEILSTENGDLHRLAAELEIHALAIEDCINRDQRPKLDDYENHQFLVWFMLHERTIYELQFLIFPDRLVIVTHEAPPSQSTWLDFLHLNTQQKDVWHLLYQAIDRATDHTWQNLKRMNDLVDRIEQDIYRNDFVPQSLFSVRSTLNEIDFSISHLSSVAEQLQNLIKPTDDLRWKLRDLCDHCERIYRTIALHRSQIGSIMEHYWGVQAHKTDRQIKRLTLIASISVPVTLWTSFWGMNFAAIPFDNGRFFVGALAVMLLSVIGTLWLLIRKGFWD